MIGCPDCAKLTEAALAVLADLPEYVLTKS
jgi:hypothetical protein